jgi:hypothetical protein
MMRLQQFANTERGRVAYVVGSGNTASYFDPAFFDNQLTVAVNQGWAEWLPKVDYMVTKYHQTAETWVGSERVGCLVVSKGHTGQLDQVMVPREDMLVFEHRKNRVQNFTAKDFPNKGLVVSYSTITSAMHFAALLGASAIVTVGADCGWLDDKSNVGDHPQSITAAFATEFEFQNRVVAHEIRSRYKIPVMSLLPFVTPNMEGHRFVSPFGAINA